MGSTKLLDKLLRRSGSFTYKEVQTLMTSLGFIENQKGHTAGSRVSFVHPASKSIFYMHRPHPENTIGKKTIDELVRFLKEEEIV